MNSLGTISYQSTFSELYPCLYLESCMFVASGGQAGIVQIHNVNRYLSFYAATDLRQELRLNS
jgi:hypothetical protein